MSAPRCQRGPKAGKKSAAPKEPICPRFEGMVVTRNGTIAIRRAYRVGWQDVAQLVDWYGKKSVRKALDRWHKEAGSITEEMADQPWPVPELPKCNVVLFTSSFKDEANILATADLVADSASAVSNDDIQAQVAKYDIKMARVSRDALLDLRNRVAAQLRE